MEVVNEVLAFVRSLLSDVAGIYGISWFFGCLLAFPILRYLFRKFLNSF